jgi:hypothetical protein
MMANGILLGLIGAAGAGKDTVAKALMATCPTEFVVMHFADDLKDLVAEKFGWDRDALDRTEFKSTPDPRWGGLTPRRALQLIGSEGFRAADSDFWVKTLLPRVVDLLTMGVHVVIPDVRFQNEAGMIRARGGALWLVQRLEKDGEPAEMPGIAHQTEELWRKPPSIDHTLEAVTGDVTGLGKSAVKAWLRMKEERTRIQGGR